MPPKYKEYQKEDEDREKEACLSTDRMERLQIMAGATAFHQLYRLRCVYGADWAMTEMRNLASMLQTAANELTISIEQKSHSSTPNHDPSSSSSTFCKMLDLKRLDPPRSYPIPAHPQVNLLVKHSMSSSPINSEGMAYRLQTVWMRNAFADACLFHTTLYAASAHLDALCGRTNNPVTLSHQTAVIQLVNRRLASEDGPDLDDATIAAIVPLAYWEHIKGNLELAQLHMQGLLQMVRARGGLDKLGFDGLLAGMILLTAISNAIVFDCTPAFSASNLSLDPQSFQLGPSTAYPVNLVAAILKRGVTNQGSSSIEIRILQDIYDAITVPGKMTGADSNSRQQILSTTSTTNSSEDFMHESCHLAALIFWCLVDNTNTNTLLTPPITTLENHVSDLKVALEKRDIITWLITAPEMLTWICLTAAAAAQDSTERAWFATRLDRMITALDSMDYPMFLEGWCYFHWLRRLYEAKRMKK
ncbi:hypothetical protein VTN77DRAFT_8422 [Rasamsonia byssochlamydoides]|uniref:uncharacterized protein n=1 Tax=Rasamsonia byssochlamydoides TaxID=89139 RepID=UPI003741F41A